MPRIRGYSFTRKDKVFADIETESGKYLFKETHRSKNKLYDINLVTPDGKTIKLHMGREQINKIKEGSSITKINFISEEGFLNYIDAQYLNREFNQEQFKKAFMGRYQYEYGWADSDTGNSAYLDYLLSLMTPEQMEELYYSNPLEFTSGYKYPEPRKSSTEEDTIKSRIQSQTATYIREAQSILEKNSVLYTQFENFDKSFKSEQRLKWEQEKQTVKKFQR